MHLTEDIIKENPSICMQEAPSLNARLAILATEVPKLGKEAAMKAIEEWGQPKSKITHLIFCTTSGSKMPSADFELCKLLELPPTIQRFMFYQQGCFAGAAALRLAKDIAENNTNGRILIIWSENATICFCAPSDEYLDNLVGSALFADGAVAVIIGSNPNRTIEHPLFQLMFSEQCTIPNSEHLAFSNIGEAGGFLHLHRDLSNTVAKTAAQAVVQIFNSKFGITDWNKLFYIVHHGGPSILDSFEAELGLTHKLRASRHVLSEYGNMWSCSMLFALDEMRRNLKRKERPQQEKGWIWVCCLHLGLV